MEISFNLAYKYIFKPHYLIFLTFMRLLKLIIFYEFHSFHYLYFSTFFYLIPQLFHQCNDIIFALMAITSKISIYFVEKVYKFFEIYFVIRFNTCNLYHC